MKCPKCGSSNVTVQAVVEQHLVDDKKHHGFLWWLLIGWWFKLLWWCVKWLVFTIPALIIAIIRRVFGLKPKKVVNDTRAKCVCQSCGHVWEP